MWNIAERKQKEIHNTVQRNVAAQRTTRIHNLHLKGVLSRALLGGFKYSRVSEAFVVRGSLRSHNYSWGITHHMVEVWFDGVYYYCVVL